MEQPSKLIFLAAAALVSAAMLVPTSGVAAQDWTSVSNNGQRQIVGSGRVVRQNRAVAPFQRIETLGSAIVQVRVGPARSVTIAADDNILPLLTSEVRGGTLTLSSRGSYRMRGPIRVWISTPNLDGVRSAGSGDTSISGINAARLALTIQGPGAIRAEGRTGRLDLAIQGSGNADLSRLAARDARAALYGSGSAVVRAAGNLDARVIGSGDLRYVGTPTTLSRHRVGSGSIRAAGR